MISDSEHIIRHSASEATLDSDHQHSISELCDMLDMSYGTVRRIMKEELHMNQVSAHWVPWLLKEEEMGCHVVESG